MTDLTDASIREIVRSEIRSIEGDLRRDLSRIESRIQDLHTLQSDLQRTLHDIDQVMGQTKALGSMTSTVAQLQASVEEIRIRSRQVEESTRYTAGYVAMMLKERYEKQN